MDIYLTEKATGYSLALSMLPEKVRVTSQALFQSYNIMSIGAVEIPSGEELQSIAWDGMLPKASLLNMNYVKAWHWLPPEQIIAVFEDWRKNGTVIRLMITETPVNQDVMIQRFEVSHDKLNYVDYSIDFIQNKELKIYTVSELNAVRASSKKNARVASNNTMQKEKKIQYIVRGTETLWDIAQRYLGDGAKYEKIYKDNKKAIGSDPSKLTKGLILTIKT